MQVDWQPRFLRCSYGPRSTAVKDSLSVRQRCAKITNDVPRQRAEIGQVAAEHRARQDYLIAECQLQITLVHLTESRVWTHASGTTAHHSNFGTGDRKQVHAYYVEALQRLLEALTPCWKPSCRPESPRHVLRIVKFSSGPERWPSKKRMLFVSASR